MMAFEVKPQCKYGANCYRKNPDHLEKFSHHDSLKRPNMIEEDEENDELNPSTKKSRLENEFTLDDFPDESPLLELSVEEDYLQMFHQEDKDEDPSTPEGLDMREELKLKFKVEMPQDLFDFWEFCCNLNTMDPTQALVPTLGLQLVGPYDVISGKFRKHKGKNKPCYVLHWRYFYDPPEFQTVMMKSDSTLHHLGYYRDDPKELPAFVGVNYANMNGVIRQQGDNLFAAVKLHINKLLRSIKDADAIVEIQRVDHALTEWAQVLGYALTAESPKLKERNKRVVTKSFHGAGLVVPVHGDVGYRELPESDANLKKIFKKIAEAKTDEERTAYFEPLQEIMTYVQFANDECDYGEGYELGIDMFSYGDPIFHKAITNVLPLAYHLLDRSEFAEILELHLSDRRHTDLSQLVLVEKSEETEENSPGLL
ncbi:histone PARylation factor 1-like isoform X2 [Apostichopus japonicus]|uniref:histone PARylation factor 1-like isoform X2 n=1 Tax=Stichopus japonicus TaxID=307972 RepID=UPI003AB4BF92